MRRRDFVKAIVAASASAKAMLGQQPAPPVAPSVPPAVPPAAPTAPGPVPWMRGLMEAKPLPIASIVPDAVAQTNANFFSEQQFATLRRLSEILLPALKGYPGAKEAGTPEFIDFLIWGFAKGASGDVSVRPGSARCRVEEPLWYDVRGIGQDAGGSIASSMVEDMDDGSSTC